MVSFFFFHSLVSHKELRFLFPLIYFVPLFISMGLDKIQMKKKYLIYSFKVFFFLFFIYNLVFFFAYSFLPAKNSIASIQFLNDYCKNQPASLYSLEENFYSLNGVQLNYYKTDNIFSSMSMHFFHNTMTLLLLLIVGQ